MIRVSLKLHSALNALMETYAYFLPGDDVPTWIATIARWNIRMSPLRLYILPRSLADRAPFGALVVGPGVAHGLESPASLPYGRIRRLYLPVESRLTPAVSDDEILRLLPGHLYVMHPSVGLIGFQETDAVALHQLIAPPAIRTEDWNRAVPGVATCPRLRSVTAPPLSKAQDLLERGRDDIATAEPDDIPALPDDPAGSVAGRAAGKLVLGMLGMLKAVSDAIGRKRPPVPSARRANAPRPGNAGGGIPGGLSQWLNRKLAAASERMLAARFKEIARLMRLMESDPDQALRYALPLSGMATRGLAAPASRLALRSTQFDLSMLGGGRAADIWDVPYDYQTKLIQQYRQAANREMGLGRFRRAAYIFAVLLGDHHSAANALRQGRHFREAAVMYKDYLKNTAEAARCLEQGGLLLEAIPLYEEREDFEKAGDLYAVLHQTPHAEEAYRKAVQKACMAGKRIAAASILENKLKAIDEAVEVLAAAWPDEPQAVECLKARLSLLGRTGRHGESRRLLGSLRIHTPRKHALPLLSTLSELSGHYSDPVTRHCLADTVRIMSSSALASATPSDARIVTHALARLCPEDRLLRRDADRYCARRSKQPITGRATPPPLPSAGRQVSLFRTVRLPDTDQWTTFAAAHGVLYAGGYGKSPKAGAKVPCLLLHDWLDEHRVLRLRQTYAQEEPLLMAVDPRQEHRVLLTALHGRRLTHRELPVGRGAFRGGLPAWAPDQIAGMTFDSTGQVWMLVVVNEQLQLSCFSPTGELQHSQLLGLLPFDAIPSVPLMLVRGSDLWFAVNSWIIWCRSDGQMAQVEMPSRILSLSATIPNSLIRLAVTLEEGGRILMTGSSWPQQIKFAEGLVDPIATLTNDGHVVAASRGVGRVYDLYRGQLRHLGDFAAPDVAPLAVLSTGTARQFAVATDRHVYVYRIA